MILAAAIGLVAGAAGILLVRRVNGEGWLYSTSLIALPVIYIAFALADGSGSIGLKELLVGLPWILGGVTTLFLDVPRSAILVGGLWGLHGIFDVAHDQLFTNPGVPGWYPALCAGTDLVVGGYLLWLSSRLRAADLRTA